MNAKNFVIFFQMTAFLWTINPLFMMLWKKVLFLQSEVIQMEASFYAQLWI